ncbi:MAG: efflux RND transporter periplasmic adaptor subunit [Desulfosalsimonas sp.]|uniref:efflux RND transporter periplasmic adaptor subunit n=1 Tax=Desulfosalsimonas sp. TaxID=3073848 RepID=UPI003970A39A
MRRSIRIGIPVLVIICLVAGGIFLVKQKKKELGQTPAYGARPRPVTVAVTEKGDLTLEKDYLAVVEPFHEARVSARVTAAVEDIRVDEGDRVKAGEVLAELEAEEVEIAVDVLSSRIEQTRAELSGSRATVEALKESHQFWQAEKKRALNLVEKGAISESEAQQTAEKAADVRGKLTAAQEKSVAIEKQIDALKKQKAELRTRRGYYTIKSPFDGIVTQRLADPGDMAAPSKNLFTVQDQSRLKIAFDVPQKDLPEVQQGQTAAFQVKGDMQKAEIRLMEPAMDKAKMMRAEIWPEATGAAGLVPGSYLPVAVIVENLKDVVLIPASALIEGPQGRTHVFTVKDNTLSANPVQLLGRAADRAAVKGIDADTQVVKNTYLGWAGLSSGEKVEAVQ